VKPTPVAHGSFTLERTWPVPPARVFAAWADPDVKAAWFMGPPETWRCTERRLDLRPGGLEVLRGAYADGVETVFSARYHAVDPDARLVFAYDMHHSGVHLSVSLATVELAPAAGGGTHMTFTEHAAFLDGQDGTRSREEGTAAHFDRLARALLDPREVLSSRVLDAPRARVFRAFSDPAELARWWGPDGFTNTIEAFDLRPDGDWRLTMHGPDGTDYPNVSRFVEVVPGSLVAYRHLRPMHAFSMRMSYADEGGRTRLTWRMRFDSDAEAERVRALVTPANEQNLDRLAAHLSASPG
jgi:uncharacterized protein YndB with AHSA1/START domain